MSEDITVDGIRIRKITHNNSPFPSIGTFEEIPNGFHASFFGMMDDLSIDIGDNEGDGVKFSFDISLDSDGVRFVVTADDPKESIIAERVFTFTYRELTK